MGHPLKFFLNKSIFLVTSRTEEGLPFFNSARYDPLFRSIVARAQTLYPVTLLAFTLEANHFHLLLSPITPENVPLFIGYIKQELAHLVNYDEKRIKKTIWADGYDSPIMEEEEVVLYYFCYLYTQSVSSRTNYCNSFAMLLFGKSEQNLPRRNRQGVEVNDNSTYTLTVDPISWLRKFHPTWSDKQLRRHVIAIVTKARRKGVRLPFLTEFREPNANEKAYVPKKRGRRLYGIFRDVSLRVKLLLFIRKAKKECRIALEEWRKGNYHYPWPPGFFPPSAVRRANVLFY